MMDGSSHTTTFAPEQLEGNQRIIDAMTDNGVSKGEFNDLVTTPTDELTPPDRDLVNDVRDDIADPDGNTVMQKVIPPAYYDDVKGFIQSRADDYIMDSQDWLATDRVGGAVTVAGDTAHLGTPAQIYDGLRLDYSGSPFGPDDAGTHVIRFQADMHFPAEYETPRNSVMGGNGAFDSWTDPFTGNGFTKAANDVIPEYIAQDVTMREGAEMWEVLDDGTQRLVAVLNKDKEWIPQGN